MKPFLTFSCALVTACAALTACGSLSEKGAASAPPSTPYLVGYLYGGTLGSLGSVDAERLTHLNYAFANVTAEGDVVLERPDDAARLAALVGLRARNPELRVLISVGGWTWSNYFSDAALTPESRERFARSAVDLMVRHRLDGLDLDWEYPGQKGEDNVFRPEDKGNFTLLLETLRAHLDAQTARDDREKRPYLLTIAAGSGASYLAHTDMAEVQQHLDFVNLMTYDFHGPWTAVTGHHANLYPSAAMQDAPSTSEAVRLFREAGVPAGKIVIGAAFYGHDWQGVTAQNGGFGQPYTGEAGSIGYAALLPLFTDGSGYVQQWDADARAAALWNPTTRHFISYESPDALRAKAAFVQAQGLGGVMFWQYNADSTGTLLRTLHDALR